MYAAREKYKMLWPKHDTRGGVVRRGKKDEKNMKKVLTNGKCSDIIAKHVAGRKVPGRVKHLEN